MKLSGEIGKKIFTRALIVAGTVAGISLVATLAKDEPEEEIETEDLTEEADSSEETKSEEE